MESRSDGGVAAGGAEDNYNYVQNADSTLQSADSSLLHHDQSDNTQLSGAHDYYEDNTDIGGRRRTTTTRREELDEGTSQNISSLPNPTRDNEHDHDDNNNNHYTLDDPFQDTPDVVDNSEQHDVPNRTLLEESDMHRKLMDIESSFLPEPSTIGVGGAMGAGADDTYLMGAQEHTEEDSEMQRPQEDNVAGEDAYKTPMPNRTADVAQHANTSALETLSSPPTTAAAARTVSRVLSDTFSSTGTQQQTGESGTHPKKAEAGDADATPVRTKSQNRDSLQEGDQQNSESPHYTLPTYSSERRRRRPKFLTNRQSAHRLSGSSALTTNTDATSSDATMGMGVDYALQSGGAAPEGNSFRPHGQGSNLARSTSLGSLASGISSGMSDDAPLERRGFSGVSDTSLHTLEEEDVSQSGQKSQSGAAKEDEGEMEGGEEDDAGEAPPATPKAKPQDAPDTITTQRFQDSVPSTALRQPFRESNLDLSPDKQGSSTGTGFSRGKHMTLKEQSSTIDRLSKENFDLKMRIHFLNEALGKRSEEGIQEMVSENVELKSDKLKLQKDLQSLRKTMRELQKQLKERGADDEGRKGEAGSDAERAAMDEEELIFLRERVETYESEIEKLRSESVARETEKRKLAEMVKTLGEGRGSVGSEAGAREERDMWKDMLDAETAAREQAEEESRRLRDELLRMKSDAGSAGPARGSQHGRMSSQVSHAASDRNFDRSGMPSSSSSRTLVELDLLKQENAELRREVSAQTSMLTSRNREKERLYQEIEDLKLGQHRPDGRSVAGDSILERSASRAADRAGSRVSEGTRNSQLSDSERDTYENRTGELRDQVATLKLENQSLRAQLDEYAAELESIDRVYQEDTDKMDENMQAVQTEREHALRIADEREAEFQDLKAEAQEELDVLNDQLDQKTDLQQRMEVELKNQEENLEALQAELRSAGEGIFRLEEDAQNNLQKYKDVQNELDDAGSALEAMEKSLFEANNKVQRLTVQQESSQNEIAFLREEQDADKIRIGDLESELKANNMSLQTEKEKTKELDQRLAEERYQREVVDSKEKQQVQKLMNELNRETTAAKDEVRKLKKSLSSREIEASTWKERLMELENSLREALGDLNGTRSSMLMSITKLQKELESTSLELESMRSNLDEKESLLRNRDALLESHGLETRKLGDLLERERQAHRADKHSFEQSLKSHNQASRTIAQNNSRITELENVRSQDRKRFNNLEQQYKDQLSERNSVFLTLWKRLSAICGPDWAHSNSLINGNLPSQEVIGNVLFWPGFSKNLLLAMKTVESQMSGCKSRIKGVERDLTKEYQSLEQNLNARLKKLDRLEEGVVQIRAKRRPDNSSNSSGNELSKLKGENRLLKAELNLLQSHTRARASGPSTASSQPRSDQNDNNNGSNSAASRGPSAGPRSSGFSPAATPTPSTPTVTSPGGGGQQGKASSSSDAGAVATQAPFYPPSHNMRSGSGSEPSQEKWTQRLRELEKRLKAEREARLMDRSGARKRLEERNAENKELRAELERQKVKSRNPPLGDATNNSRRHRQLAVGGTDGQSDERKGGHRSGSSVARRTDTGHSHPRSGNREGDHEDEDEDDGAGSGHMVVIRQSHEPPDSYDGEDGYDTGTGTGTDDGEPFTVEVEV